MKISNPGSWPVLFLSSKGLNQGGGFQWFTVAVLKIEPRSEIEKFSFCAQLNFSLSDLVDLVVKVVFLKIETSIFLQSA